MDRATRAGYELGLGAEQVKLVEGKELYYTLYLHPTSMRWRQGTGWPWLIYAYEPAKRPYAQNYTITWTMPRFRGDPVEKAPTTPPPATTPDVPADSCTMKR